MKGIDKYQFFTLLLSIAVVLSLIYFIYSIFTGEFGKIVVKIDVANRENSKAVINNVSYDVPVNITDIKPNTELNIEILGQENTFVSKYLPATNTALIIKRDLGVSNAFSSGQSIWYQKIGGDNSAINIVSENSVEVEVYIDDQFIGVTPLYIEESTLATKNDENKYVISFRQDGYEEQTVKVKLLKGHSLDISVNMFLIPIPNNIGLLNQLPDGVYFLDFTNNQDLNSANKKEWAKAINYWFKTRGDFISGNIRLNEIAYFIDNEGKIYNNSGNEVSNTDIKLEKDDKIVYLGNANESGVNKLAEESLKKFFDGKELSGSTIKVFITPNSVGFLRVREQPSTGSKELTKVETNASYPFVEEDQGWYKIEYESGKQGWVSGIYSELINDNVSDNNINNGDVQSDESGI